MFRRMESGERWWAAEIALRGLGALLLGVTGLSASWLHRAVGQSPAQDFTIAEFAVAALGVAALGMGLAFLFEGPGLFRLIPVPGRHTTFKF